MSSMDTQVCVCWGRGLLVAAYVTWARSRITENPEVDTQRLAGGFGRVGVGSRTERAPSASTWDDRGHRELGGGMGEGARCTRIKGVKPLCPERALWGQVAEAAGEEPLRRLREKWKEKNGRRGQGPGHTWDVRSDCGGRQEAGSTA